MPISTHLSMPPPMRRSGSMLEGDHKGGGSAYGRDTDPADAHHELFRNPQRLHRLPQGGVLEKYLAEHEGDILIHKAAKKAFDAFGLKKLPTVRSLNEEFARLLAEKKAAYAEYHRAQEQMRELLIHKANAAYLLGLDEQNRQTTERQREEK